MTLKTNERIYVGGHPTDVVGRDDLVREFISDCDGFQGEAKLVFDVNGQGISMYATNPEYRNAVNSADIIHADGQIVVGASARINPQKPIPQRSATTDIIHDLAKISSKRSVNFFLLGGPEGVAQRASEVLKETYPDLHIVGTHHGYFSEKESLDVIEKINRAQPDVVWVGLGKPREQIFCDRYKSEFQAPWVVTCGGCFHYITGDYSRAPRFMQACGLEWMHRMVSNPKKLFWRYVKTNPHAMWLVLTQSKRSS